MRILRQMIVTTVALVVPLQGMATVAAGVCMALGHHEAPAMSHHEHEGHDGGHSREQATEKSHCAPCVACCAAAAISSSDFRAFPEAPALAVAASPHRLLLESPPGNLERPPLAL